MIGRGLLAAAIAGLLMMHGGAEARADAAQGPILYERGSEEFDEIHPVTENLNSILAQISRREVEAGGSLPSFIVYPYEEGESAPLPYALVWAEAGYVSGKRIPADQVVYVIYDPRRNAVGEETTEDGQRVEYRHYVVTWKFAADGGGQEGPAASATRLEPTSTTVYLRRAVLEEGGRARTTREIHGFPRIVVPGKIGEKEAKGLSLTVESGLPVDADHPGLESLDYPDLASFGID